LIKQRPCVGVSQPAELELRQPGQALVVGRLAHREDHRGRRGRQVSGDERERLGRGRVQPLRVVHHADQRSLAGQVRQQAQGCHDDREAVRDVSAAHAERDPQRVPLRIRETPDSVQEWRAQLVEPGERQLHFLLDTGHPHDAAAGRALRQVIQQRGLAGSRLTADDQNPALA
jgi:hypothetical protein